MASPKMASLLTLLYCGGQKQSNKKPAAVGTRLFECKTCSRRFPTFQALGGHRTSHRRPRVRRNDDDGCDRRQMLKLLKPTLHECPVCGLAFPMGQALGGHMRRHKLAAADLHAEEEEEEKKKKKTKHSARAHLLWLDLNLPPLENELQLRSIGFEFMDEQPEMRNLSSCSSPA